MAKNKIVLKSKSNNTSKYYINFSKTSGKLELELNVTENHMLSENGNFLMMENGSYEYRENIINTTTTTLNIA